MERGELQRPEFMREIVAMTREIVEKTKRYESDTVPGDFATSKTPCPKCGGVIKENYKKFQCQTVRFFAVENCRGAADRAAGDRRIFT